MIEMKETQNTTLPKRINLQLDWETLEYLDQIIKDSGGDKKVPALLRDIIKEHKNNKVVEHDAETEKCINHLLNGQGFFGTRKMVIRYMLHLATQSIKKNNKISWSIND